MMTGEEVIRDDWDAGVLSVGRIGSIGRIDGASPILLEFSIEPIDQERV